MTCASYSQDGGLKRLIRLGSSILFMCGPGNLLFDHLDDLPTVLGSNFTQHENLPVGLLLGRRNTNKNRHRDQTLLFGYRRYGVGTTTTASVITSAFLNTFSPQSDHANYRHFRANSEQPIFEYSFRRFGRGRSVSPRTYSRWSGGYAPPNAAETENHDYLMSRQSM